MWWLESYFPRVVKGETLGLVKRTEWFLFVQKGRNCIAMHKSKYILEEAKIFIYIFIYNSVYSQSFQWSFSYPPDSLLPLYSPTTVTVYHTLTVSWVSISPRVIFNLCFSALLVQDVILCFLFQLVSSVSLWVLLNFDYVHFGLCQQFMDFDHGLLISTTNL